MGIRVNTLGIAGVGLIGGSIGLAARANGFAGRVLGIGRSESRLRAAVDAGAIDGYTTDFAGGTRQSDLLYLATPVGVIIEQIHCLRGITDVEIVVTDAGSTKAEIVRAAAALPPNIHFVGGHPMAGSEKSGVEAASAGLLHEAVYALTPDSSTTPRALEIVGALAEAAGARVLLIGAEEHDRAVAITSHLPHIVAGILVRLAARGGEQTARLTAGSFRDLTRVADSPPALWGDIAITNAGAILDAAREFRDALDEIESLIRAGAPEGAREWFAEGSATRNSLTSAGDPKL